MRNVASAIAVACVALAFAGGAAAAGKPVFVSAPGGPNCGGGSAYPTINDALAHVAPGGTVHVCPGTYHEDVVVGTASVTLQGANATIAPDANDASPLTELGLGNNGFTVMAPNVTLRGFTVQGATGDGVLVLGDHALVQNITALDNGINGINLEGSSWSTVRDNVLSGNASGLELVNDPAGVPADVLASLGVTGSSQTASHDLIEGNQVVENPLACGILLVDHVGAGGDLGIHDNVIRGNTVTNNAMAGFGAGILLASPVPGGAVYDNLIAGNTVSGNGLSGITLHSHIPGQDFSGNAIVGNAIGTNNLRGFEEPDDTQTTGIFLGSQDPLSITISGNTISDDTYGIFTAGPVTLLGGGNSFDNVTTPIGTKPTFTS
jgi:parallel beta-helix repeat protein